MAEIVGRSAVTRYLVYRRLVEDGNVLRYAHQIIQLLFDKLLVFLNSFFYTNEPAIIDISGVFFNDHVDQTLRTCCQLLCDLEPFRL